MGKAGKDNAYQALVEGLNGSSGVRLCGNVPGGERGCIAPDVNHNKFATFSKVVLDDGTVHNNVVFQSSANLTDWYLNQSYNDSYTVADDPRLYNGYVNYVRDLFTGSALVADPDTGLHWQEDEYFRSVAGTKAQHHAYFYPRAQSGDVIADELKKVQCRYQEGGQTKWSTIRIAMLSFTAARKNVAQALVDLASHGCWIGVIYDSGTNPNDNDNPAMDPEIEHMLYSAGATLKITGSNPHDDYYVGWLSDMQGDCAYGGRTDS